MRTFRRSGIASSKAVKTSWLLCVFLAGFVIFSTSLLQAQLIDVHFNNDSYGAGNGGPSTGPDMSGAVVLGASGDQWNNIEVNSGTGIPLIYVNGSNSPVTMTFTSGGGYDVNAFGGSTPFASTPYDALMEDYLFNSAVPQTNTLSGLAANSKYNLVLYSAADVAGAGRTTLFTVNGNTQSSTWNGSSSTLIAGIDYVEFTSAMSDGSGNLVIIWTGNGSAEGDINGFQIQSVSPVSTLPVTQVSGGLSHSLFIESDGSLWVMGDNTYGQLGLGSTITNVNLPQPLNSGVRTVAAGGYHSLFVKSGNSLWAMGGNFDGQLGDGTYNNQYSPEEIASSQVSVIAAGITHSLFGKYHEPIGPGSLWAMGWNQYGQLGDGGTRTTNAPEDILNTVFLGNPAVTAVAAGAYHSLFIEPGGSLWAMGDDYYGQLGDTNSNFSTGIVQQDMRQEIVSSNVTAITAGLNASLFIKSDGSLWGMGNNGAGQLGPDADPYAQDVPIQIVASNVTAVAEGNTFTLFIKSDGSLWGMGENPYGQLGLGPTYVGEHNGTHVPLQIVASNVVAVATGYGHSLFIKSDGSLWGMGNNADGELGDGTYSNRYYPEQIVPRRQPVIGTVSSAGNTLVLSGNGGQPYQPFYTLTSSSLGLSFSQWTTMSSNMCDADGNFSVTNPVNPAASQQFYIIQMQN
jgi:alpha-tubulin suppressor-like RCC1 family protein